MLPIKLIFELAALWFLPRLIVADYHPKAVLGAVAGARDFSEPRVARLQQYPMSLLSEIDLKSAKLSICLSLVA